MRAMVLPGHGQALEVQARAVPDPSNGQLLLQVSACGVCRTDLHVVDGDLRAGAMPVIPGHEIAARVLAVGPGVEGFTEGERVGVPWLG